MYAFIMFNLQVLNLRLKNIQWISRSHTKSEITEIQTTANMVSNFVYQTAILGTQSLHYAVFRAQGECF